MEFIDTSMQPILDRYQETGVGEDELYNYLYENWEKYTSYEGAAADYLGIIQEARRVDLTIVGIDISPLDRANHDTDRDRKLAKNVRAIFDRDPNARVITYTGQDHAEKRDNNDDDNTMARRIAQDHKVTSVVINGLDVYPGGVIRMMKEKGNTFGIENSRFMIPLQSAYPSSPYGFDWFINAP